MPSKHLRARRTIASLLAAAAAIAPASATLVACYGETGYIAYESPPPPRYEYYSYRPGYVWAGGYWGRDGGRWAWHGGHYERERAGFVYNQPRWERRGDHHVLVNGGWRHEGVVIRDHRR